MGWWAGLDAARQLGWMLVLTKWRPTGEADRGKVAAVNALEQNERSLFVLSMQNDGATAWSSGDAGKGKGGRRWANPGVGCRIWRRARVTELRAA